MNHIEENEEFPSDPSDSSSSSSESSISSDSGGEAGGHGRKRHRTRSRSKTQSRSTKSKKTLLKPLAPLEYDGVADARSYHQFVTEGTDYVVSGRVHKRRRVFVLSYYLKGKAYNFYTQKIAMNVYDWDLKQFFKELFNYCFPINYRMKQRERLCKCFQNTKTVSEFIYELEEIINMIGLIDEQEKVIRLWDGLRPIIQKGLWRDGYNPEVSTWEEIKHAAQVIEISEEVSDGREHRVTFDRNTGTSFAGSRRIGRNFYCNSQNDSNCNGNRNYSRNDRRQEG
jgi:Retrotransposon gag protein